MHTFHSKANTFSRNLTSYFDSKLSSFGLATSYVELLMLLKKNGGYTQKDLAEQLSLAPSTITRFIDKLIKQNLVVKHRSGREVSVELTDKGNRLSSEMDDLYSQALADLEEVVGEKFIHTVGKLLEYGNKALNDLDEKNNES